MLNIHLQCCDEENRRKTFDADADNYTGYESENETANSSSYTDNDASCLTQEITGTVWTTMANMKDTEFFEIDDKEPDKVFLSDQIW